MEKHFEKIKQTHIEIDESLQHTQTVYAKYYNKKYQLRLFSIGDHIICYECRQTKCKDTSDIVDNSEKSCDSQNPELKNSTIHINCKNLSIQSLQLDNFIFYMTSFHQLTDIIIY